MTDTLAISAGIAGAALFFPRIFDVITDPIMGLISDRTKSRWGRRRPFFIVGAVVTGIALAFLFNCPDFDSVSARLTYVISLYVLMQLGVTIFMVPYYAFPAELSDDPHERTKLMSVRAAFTFCGGLVGGALAPWLVLKGGGGQDGYALMSAVVGFVCGAAFISAFFGTRKARIIEHEIRSFPIVQQFKVAVSNRPFRIFMVSFIAYVAAFGSFVASIPYYAAYIIENRELLAVVWLCVQISAIISIPAWTILAGRQDKHRVFIFALGLMSLASVMLFFGDKELPMLFLYLTCVLWGAGFGGTQVACWAMLPDVIQWDYVESGIQRGGIFAGFMTAFEKTGLAIGGLLTGSILAWTGYVESATGDVIQSANALTGIKLAIGASPAVLFLLSVILITAYPLTHKVLREGEACYESR